MLVTGIFNFLADSSYNSLNNSKVTLDCQTALGAVTINLPSIKDAKWGRQGGESSPLRLFIVDKDNNASINNITINAFVPIVADKTITTPPETINGATSIVVATNGAVIELEIADNGHWSISSKSNSASGSAFSAFANFFGLTAGIGNGGASDYVATIPVSTGVIDQGIPFPRIGANVGGLSQPTPRKDSVLIPVIGTYKVAFNISNVVEAGQLNIEQSTDAGASWTPFAPTNDSTLFGRATGTSQIVGVAYVVTTVANQLIRIANATGNATALTIASGGSGTHAISAHVFIEKIA